MPALLPALRKAVLPSGRRSRETPEPRPRRGGLIRSVVMRLATIGAVSLAAYLLVPLGVALVTNHLRSLEHQRAHHPDASNARVRIQRALPDGSVALVVRDEAGRLRRVVAEQAEADRFLNAQLAALDEARARAKAEARRNVDQTLQAAFADGDEAIGRFADWFFAWSRSYRILQETVASAVTRLFEPGDTEPLHVAVERDVRDYLMRHYKAQVLKPELRDPLVGRGFDETARQAHDGFRRSMAEQSQALQLFLASHTRHLETLPDAALAEARLDWDAQRWKAPTYLMEGRGFDALVGLGWAGAGGALGAATLGPALDAALARAFAGAGARLAAQAANRMALAQGGAAAGLAFPAGGPVVGAALGVALGFGADYLVNAAKTRLERPAFVAANREALDATIAAWRDLLARSLDQAIDAWFDDARAAVLRTREAARS